MFGVQRNSFKILLQISLIKKIDLLFYTIQRQRETRCVVWHYFWWALVFVIIITNFYYTALKLVENNLQFKEISISLTWLNYLKCSFGFEITIVRFLSISDFCITYVAYIAFICTVTLHQNVCVMHLFPSNITWYTFGCFFFKWIRKEYILPKY